MTAVEITEAAAARLVDALTEIHAPCPVERRAHCGDCRTVRLQLAGAHLLVCQGTAPTGPPRAVAPGSAGTSRVRALLVQAAARYRPWPAGAQRPAPPPTPTPLEAARTWAARLTGGSR